MMKNLEIGQDAILITGPTASGKSALAVALAKQHNGVVVNADSMQVYDTLHVLTARPFETDMQGVVHHLYGHVPVSQHYSTGEWFRDAVEVLQAVRSAGKIPVFVGGTGLYFKALTGGLSDMPPVPETIRDDVRRRLLTEGPEALHAILTERDPETAAILRPGDGQRIARALEIFEATSQSIRVFQARQGPVAIDLERAMKIVVLPERALLRQRIDRRFAGMLKSGAVEEVEALLSLDLKPEMPAMKAIGVPQIAAFLSGTMSKAEVIETSSAATRQYAKRQMTWFRNQLDESWQRWDPAGA
ncbi:tRNA (adenosine(37)-N6)-dimethylallyltransferase MiaA [Rhizobium sp. LjRoot98]|uniref:tRNA (adenosine(37)-N6)-dimethylallyltransferase MiaA n=1 Tax=unclassified Rhizobium TaxID=2613769 RepID=UPI000712DD20|nr:MULTISPECIES: tRNA (adenosine(37)-N6)-dimethylallyltransferase MiaA [unclassified Rhizobium]KQV29411.1 tRNA dimethylallyltransferase [Rhizobium sp. Root1204]KQY05333.1 tRNA dimethylallyltransferase [Rhizobium sp. Root1334]KRC01950.1 tRNA dimethylallyltransferase [Rhizobium sp. Root73]